MKFLILILSLYFIPFSLAQNVDIIPYLIQIERGAIDSVVNELVRLKIIYPQSPDIMFLEAITMPDAKKSEEIFIELVEKHPQSKYADASAYRLFNYYLIQDESEMIDKYYQKLKTDYPESPYLKIAQSQYELLSSKTIQEKQFSKTEIKKSINYSYTIQAGAFVKKENAQTLKSQLEKSGIYSEIKEKNVAGTFFNVVYAGKFATREDAENFLTIINYRFNIQGRVVEIGK